MASHTFCRAKPLTQQPCRASDALAIVQDLLANGTSSLADDVQANILNLETQLQLLQQFPEVLIDEGAAARCQPAATPPRAGVAVPAAATPSTIKDREARKKRKEVKEGAVPPVGGKKDKKEKKDKGSSRKRSAEGSAGEEAEEGKAKRKKKKHKTDA